MDTDFREKGRCFNAGKLGDEHVVPGTRKSAILLISRTRDGLATAVGAGNVFTLELGAPTGTGFIGLEEGTPSPSKGVSPLVQARRQLASCPIRFGPIIRIGQASANPRRQHGHSPSCPLSSAENAVGCGIVIIALNANGARWA